MKFKKFIAIATAAAFALTGTAYADTGENLATEGSDVSQVIEDISLMGDRIDADDSSYYTGDMTVNFSVCDEDGIRSVAIIVNGETIAARSYDSDDAIATEDGEVMNADSTIETEGEDAVSNTTEPLTTVSDSLIIGADEIKALADAKATEPQQEEPAAEEATEEPAVDETSEEPAAEAADDTAETPIANTFTAEMVVTDVNGQTATKEFEFNAAIAETPAEEQEAVDELKAAGLGDVQIVDATTYRVEVNLTHQVVTMYKKNMEGTYEPVRVAICSTARAGCSTPVGTWTIGPSGSKCGRSRWALMSSGKSYAQYLVRFKSGKCFHSVIYKTRGDNSKMYKSEYNKLGTVASAGCVRLQAIDAKWIYDHCPDGTKVRVYKDSIASPLGKPVFNKLTTSGTYSWDPTDPDIGNPFRGGAGTPTGIYVSYEDGNPVITLDPDITKHNVVLSASTYTFNGSVRTPAVGIYGLEKGLDFEVAYPEGRKYVGTYDITVTGKGTFFGTKTAKFTIVPQSTKISSLKRSGSKKFKVKYKKIKKQISGYQIMYSKNKSFKSGNKTVNAKGYKSISKTVNVGSKGTYYVKVRVYKTVNDVTYYSGWSAVKKVKVK